ncbi:hypothetical protein GOP47_0020806 [Adiantum capillus-veneris]|uniref:Uncharacterized protein n=1 Tax=Adiantum capillus-veneris TaxID=13818 RepID=A0A9D4Z918_ADICA|nr:hypothetical protein GOP47_0020806 [Adiantum capillus-veneris]
MGDCPDGRGAVGYRPLTRLPSPYSALAKCNFPSFWDLGRPSHPPLLGEAMKVSKVVGSPTKPKDSWSSLARDSNMVASWFSLMID